MATSLVGGVRRASGWSIAVGILMIIAGMIAIFAPLEAGLVVVIVVGWMAIFNGGAQLVYAFSHEARHRWLEGLLGLIYIIAGIYLLMHPLGGLLAITLLVGSFLVIYGVFALILAFQMRPNPGWGMGAIRRHRHHPAGHPDLHSLADEHGVGDGHTVRHQLHRFRNIASDGFTGSTAFDHPGGLAAL